jgi:hypothetical protein
MKKSLTFSLKQTLVAAVLLCMVGSGAVYAASNSTLSQVINGANTLSTDILDSGRNPVASPAVSMSAKNFSFDCQAGGNASTGTFGTGSERIYVTNSDGADNGWTLTLAATGGATARWANGGASQHIDFNDPAGGTAGCTDGGDTDSTPGQLTINPSAGSITTDCTSCNTTGVSVGSSTAFNQGTTDNVTLINAGSTSTDIWRGYLTGVTASQTIPAEQVADTYTLNLTLTATAQ